MKDRKSSVRTLILTIAAALFVVLLIAFVAFFASREQNRNKITLPSSSSSAKPPAVQEEANGFVTVTRENAADVVESLLRPLFYHQSLSRQTLSGTDTSTASVQIWAQGEQMKLTVTETGQTRNILTNGKVAYVWYSDAPSSVRKTVLPADVTADDLSGVLTYESILALPDRSVLQAEYLQLTDMGDIPGLFVAADDGNGAISRFWIDLASGLLCRAECLQGSTTTYLLSQTGLELLNETDSALAAQMLLPDGTEPTFTTEEE